MADDDDCWLDDDMPEPREEPDCGVCNDSGWTFRQPVDRLAWKNYRLVWGDHRRGRLIRRLAWRRCPDCQPTWWVTNITRRRQWLAGRMRGWWWKLRHGRAAARRGALLALLIYRS